MFKEIFGYTHEDNFFSPGRINILGEHIDYNGGYCLPMAINHGTKAYVGKNNEKIFRVYSNNYKKEHIYEIKDFSITFKDDKFGWSNIFRGMIYVIGASLQNIDFGLDIYFEGNIPPASGLSSSASISMLIGVIFNHYYKLNLSILDLVFLTQRMENEFLGTKTGILDQYAIGFAKKNTALLLDASKPTHDYYSSDFGDYVFLIVATNKTRTLADSKYNQRVDECRKGLTIIKKTWPNVKNLCSIEPYLLPEVEKIITDKTIFKRVRHCINEQARTLTAANSLNNIEKLGKLLYEGHESLRDDYEVTGRHLDFIYNFSKQKDYVAGARMTGAGFGGSGIVLIKKDKVDEYSKEFAAAYQKEFKIEPTFIIAESSGGVGKC